MTNCFLLYQAILRTSILYFRIFFWNVSVQWLNICGYFCFVLFSSFEFYSSTDFWLGVCFWIVQLSPVYWALVHNLKQSQSTGPGLLLDETDWRIHSRNKSNAFQPVTGCSAPSTRPQLVQGKSLKTQGKWTCGPQLGTSAPALFYYLPVRV